MYGGVPYAGGPYAGDLVDAADIPADGEIHTAIEVAFTTDALSATPAFVDIGLDCRMWDSVRGRSGELERFPPGRATVVLDNENGDYDSHNASGPWYGHLKPNRRLRIRETLNGVTYTQFDGFVDRWGLDYANVGKDATATVTATDATKLLAREETPRSVYELEVDQDTPEFWWRLDEGLEEGQVAGRALNYGTVGEAGTGTYVGSFDLESDRLVANDPGGSIKLTNNTIAPGTPASGVDIPSSQINVLQRLQDGLPLTVEFWARPLEDTSFGTAFYQEASTPAISGFQTYWFSGGVNTGRFAISVHTDTVTAPVSSSPPGSINHLVYRFTPSGADQICDLFLNGALVATGTLNDTLNTGTIVNSAIGHTISASSNWVGNLSQFAIYLDALDSTRIAAHYAAGTHPWQGDTPATRLERLADLAGLPANMRDFDPGLETLQSVDFSTGLLDNVYKVGETEFGLLFWSRDGKLTLVDRTALFGRLPVLTYGDGAGEAGYRDLGLEDGEGALRNTATISRLQGVAKTAVDAGSVADYGRFTYTLEGLLHDDDDTSQNYANLIVAEYGEMRRRVSRLQVGPPVVGEEDLIWPAVLLPELGDAVTVGKGDFEQVAAIEGIHHVSRPGEDRTATFTLSPEFAVRALEDEEVATLGYAQVTASQTGITAAVDLTGLSDTVTVGTNRLIRITASGLWQNTGAGNRTLFSIFEGATALRTAAITHVTANVNESLETSVVLVAPTAGSHTYKLVGQAGAGTSALGPSAANPAFILIEDIGPVV